MKTPQNYLNALFVLELKSEHRTIRAEVEMWYSNANESHRGTNPICKDICERRYSFVGC